MTMPSHGLPALIERLDAWLPQTQCQQCGYPRCREYAEALATSAADINQCPPGGEVTIQALSALLQLASKPLDPRFGRHQPRARAMIDENLCIGCRKCIDACPVDAILGARQLMHTVIAHECTGCELCLPPCPVDCIAMVPVLIEHARSASGSPPSPLRGRGNEGEGELGDDLWPDYARAETDRWRRRTEQRVQRLARTKRSRRAMTSANPPLAPDRDRIRADIRAAVSRVRTNKQRASGSGSSSA
ncbi:MAG: RnfABCDGE type electron transport complex subunit B [Sulfuricaulis sp.]|nr:RnfABCDGE type electron transport complex subunit B [Sulfuricaulis sp.]